MPGWSRETDRSACNADHAVGVSFGTARDVLVNGRRPLFMTNRGLYGMCCSKAAVMWVVSEGTATVLINGEFAAGLRMATAHQSGKGTLIDGSPDVLIGGPTITMEELARTDALALLDKGLAALLRWNSADRQHFSSWFGSDSHFGRLQMIERNRQMRTVLESVRFEQRDDDDVASTYRESGGPIFLERDFWTAPRHGANSRAGTLIHEASHRYESGSTLDACYGQPCAQQLARDIPPYAAANADNVEYYYETL
jgi:hypothetical protein